MNVSKKIQAAAVGAGVAAALLVSASAAVATGTFSAVYAGPSAHTAVVQQAHASISADASPQSVSRITQL